MVTVSSSPVVPVPPLPVPRLYGRRHLPHVFPFPPPHLPPTHTSTYTVLHHNTCTLDTRPQSHNTDPCRQTHTQPSAHTPAYLLTYGHTETYILGAPQDITLLLSTVGVQVRPVCLGSSPVRDSRGRGRVRSLLDVRLRRCLTGTGTLGSRRGETHGRRRTGQFTGRGVGRVSHPLSGGRVGGTGSRVRGHERPGRPVTPLPPHHPFRDFRPLTNPLDPLSRG